MVGDLIELRAGERIPVDGLVRSGRSSLNTAPITGESVPVEVEPGALAFGGSINLDGQLLVEIARVGEQTTLGRVLALIQAAERAKPPATRLLERYAGQYMTLVLLIAAGLWFATGNVAAMLASWWRRVRARWCWPRRQPRWRGSPWRAATAFW